MLIMPKLLKHRGRISSALGTLSQTWSLAFDKSHPSDTADLHPREMRDSEHSKLTSAIARQPLLADASIEAVHQITPSVKRLRLHVQDRNFSFQPGQWIDFHAPGVPIIGGYSIVSPPSQLTSLRTFDIAVKQSSHPPAHWVHTQAVQGVRVKVQVGGEYVLATADLGRPLLFIAGGIGITPLMSMITYYVEKVPSLLKAGMQPSATLLYSAGYVEELAFRAELNALQESSEGRLAVAYFVTQEVDTGAPQEHTRIGLEYRRLRLEDMSACLQQAGHSCAANKGPLMFLCGPPQMCGHVAEYAQSLGMPKGCVRTEKWW